MALVGASRLKWADVIFDDHQPIECAGCWSEWVILIGVIKVGSTLVTCTDTAEMTKVLEGSSLHVF